MSMNRFFALSAILATLSGCQSMTSGTWSADYNSTATGNPAAMRYGTYRSINDMDTRRVAVLLPLSGTNADLGREIRAGVEMAALSAGADNLSVSFHDTGANPGSAINAALYTNPEVIIGPVFADQARALRNAKSSELPVLSFTSDATAIGDGIMTMALMPSNSIEAIIREIRADNSRGVVVIAPDTTSGHLMAGIAKRATEIYGVPTTGIFFYKEKDTNSIKSATSAASMNTARTAANNRAREILSDILTNEQISGPERQSIARQLENLAREETLGPLPYDAVLFLGTGDDSKSAASFMRYFGVSARDATFYGTAMWDGADLESDFTMTGAKFASLPPVNPQFANLYEMTTGHAPSRIAGFGYDATNMALGMMYSQNGAAAYLLNPSGYAGTDGVMRLRPTGDSERALRIMRLDGSGTAKEVRSAPTNFLTPLYNVDQRTVSPAYAQPLATPGVNPSNYIQIPERLRGKYRSQTYGANMAAVAAATLPTQSVVTIQPTEDDTVILTSPDFQPQKIETVQRTYIDSVEIEE